MDECIFPGFWHPDQEYFTRLTIDWFEECAKIDNIAELKVMLYLARHTWGFLEYDLWKHLTIDEFMKGRYSNGERMDSGTGLSEQSVRTGLKKAIGHGYILEKTDEHDKARIRKSYKLKMYKEDSSGV